MPRRQRKSRIKKEKIWGIFIVILMVGSAFGIIFGGYANSSETIKYNGHKFTATPQGWQTKIDGKYYLFTFSPNNLEDMPVDNSFDDLIGNSPQIDFTSDPESPYTQTIAQVQFDIDQLLMSMNKYSQTGFTAENEYNSSIFTCDRTNVVPLLYFKEGEETSISVEGSCIILSATNNDMFFALRDRVIYSLLGVME